MTNAEQNVEQQRQYQGGAKKKALHLPILLTIPLTITLQHNFDQQTVKTVDILRKKRRVLVF